MDELKLIYDQIESTFRGKSWYGPNMVEILENVSADKARNRPISQRHSIWELVNHINYWMSYALKVVDGADVSNPTEGEDWPAVGSTELEWRESVAMLELNVNSLLNSLMNFSESKLEENVPGKPYNYRVLLHGVLQHNLYHMGQMAVLK